MADPDAPAIDLIVPARNEEANLPALFAALAGLPPGLLRRVVVVDNASTDRTAERARHGGAVVVPEARRGYGAACLAGLAWIATQAGPPPRAVAFLDADLADDPAALPALCQPVLDGTADLALGSRPRLAEPGALDAHQRFGNALACTLLRLATGHRFGDLGPLRVIRWTSLQQLAMQDRTWGWTVEMQYKAVRHRLRIVERDVPYRRRHAGQSKISGTLLGSARAGTRILHTVASLWWRDGRIAPAAADPGR